MPTLYAIDPGTEQSALVSIDGGRIWGEVVANDDLSHYLALEASSDRHLVIEEIASYGMPVGREVFQTCVWTGRFIEVWRARGGSWSLLPRKDVKLALCGSLKAKDSNVRMAVLDRFGGKEKAIGKKAAPGPLYGIKSHAWAALALALAYQEQAK